MLDVVQNLRQTIFTQSQRKQKLYIRLVYLHMSASIPQVRTLRQLQTRRGLRLIASKTDGQTPLVCGCLAVQAQCSQSKRVEGRWGGGERKGEEGRTKSAGRRMVKRQKTCELYRCVMIQSRFVTCDFALQGTGLHYITNKTKQRCSAWVSIR